MKKVTLLVTFVLMIAFANAQTADEIIQKHLEKIGGAKAWSEVKSTKMNGKLKDQRGLADIETAYIKEGPYYGSIVVDGEKRIEFGFDGEIYWRFDKDTEKMKKRTDEESARAKKGAKDFPSHFLNYKKLGYTVERLEDDNIKGVECYTLEINKGPRPKFGEMVDEIVYSYISKEDYLEIAAEYEYISGLFEGIMYVYYEDYKEVDGKTIPFKTTHVLNESSFTIIVDSYEFNPEVDRSVFNFGD